MARLELVLSSVRCHDTTKRNENCHSRQLIYFGLVLDIPPNLCRLKGSNVRAGIIQERVETEGQRDQYFFFLLLLISILSAHRYCEYWQRFHTIELCVHKESEICCPGNLPCVPIKIFPASFNALCIRDAFVFAGRDGTDQAHHKDPSGINWSQVWSSIVS